MDEKYIWFEVDGINDNSASCFELKYLDKDNQYMPTAWPQIVKKKKVAIVHKHSLIGFQTEELSYDDNCSGIEIRLLKEDKKFNLLYQDKLDIAYWKIKMSRNTLLFYPKSNGLCLNEVNISIEATENFDIITFFNISQFKDYIVSDILFKKRLCQESDFGSSKEIPFERIGDKCRARISHKEYDYSYNDFYTYDFYVKYKNVINGFVVEIPLRICRIREQIFENSIGSRKYYRTMDGKLAVYIKKKSEIPAEKKDNQLLKKINLAAWGSCYLRNMFAEKYNPDWKRIFNVVDSYFWFSAISCMSEPCENDSLYKLFIKKSSEKNTLNVERELKKKAFENLKKCSIDYMLVDFYADAMHGVRKISEKCYVGQGTSFSPDMQLKDLYEDHIQGVYKKLDYRYDGYWEVWCKYCDSFITRITEMGFQDKIILVEGNFAYSFINSKYLVRKYDELDFGERYININNLKARESLWNRMNDYFKKTIPNVKTLNMSDYKYLGDLDNKLLGPNHFEKNYYKSEMAELCKIIVMDKCKVN